MGLDHVTPARHPGGQAQSGVWSLLLPPVQPSSERAPGRGPGPPRARRSLVLWAADFPWVPDHSPGSQRLCVLSKQPASAPPPPPRSSLPSSPPPPNFTWRFPRCSSRFQNHSLSRLPQTEACPREVTSRGPGPGKQTLPLPASQGRRLQPPGHQDVGGTHQHPRKSDLRKL